MNEKQIAINTHALMLAAEKLEVVVANGGLTDPFRFVEGLVLSVLADGWRPVEPPPPLHGPSSTEEGRARARRIFEESRAAAVAEWDALRATRLRRSAEQGAAGTPTTPRTDTTTQGNTARCEEKR